MDPNAVNANITVDDFDSILDWPDNAVWSTPDPSSAGFSGNDPAYLRGTYHTTTTKNAVVNLNFTGPAIYIYGHKGTQYGSFQVKIDSATSEHSAYSETNSTAPTLLYAASNLTYARHSLSLMNLGAVEARGDKGGDAFLLDFLHLTAQLGPSGATIRNVTYEEDSDAITYAGEWGSNTGPVFSGGGTTYTNDDGATATFRFNGSAVYVFGDIKNDHRIFGVKLDNETEELHNGTSGCGGAFGLTCEQQVPILKYFGSNLDDSEHTITITNYAGVNNSFFDLDSIVVVETSAYAPRNLSLTTGSPFVDDTDVGGNPGTPIPSGLAGVGAANTGGNTNAGGDTTDTGNATTGYGFSDSLLLVVFTLFFLSKRKL